MPTLKAYRRQMLQMVPYSPAGGLGRTAAISSLSTTTVVSTANLAVGTLPSQYYAGRWMLRADAASAADRERQISAYASSTGTLTHAGTNFADTTATSEIVEILRHEPWRYDYAIDETIRRLRHLDRQEIPLRKNANTYWIAQLAPNITQASDIVDITSNASPVISTNRYFDKWNTINSSGTLTPPDDWELNGASATVTRATDSANLKNRYRAVLTRSTNDCNIAQVVGLLGGRVSGDDLRGETVTAVGIMDTDGTPSMRMRIYDGTTITYSSAHTGSDNPEELSCSATVGAAVSYLSVAVMAETADGAGSIHEAYLYVGSSGDDAVRRDYYPEHRFPYRLGQSNGGLTVETPLLGWPGQLVITAYRSYPQFDATRLAGGSADGDSSDAPLIPVATGAIARLYEGLAQTEDKQAKEYGRLADIWNRRFEELALGHAARRNEKQNFGMTMLPGGYAPAARGR